jgi:hypothetical protein
MVDVSRLEQEETGRKDCFLCRPNTLLISSVREGSCAIAGLGPIVQGYSIVGTREHGPLTQFSEEQIRGYATHVLQSHHALKRLFGTCLITEHGNLPICALEDDNRTHCYHPHMLLFPGVSSIEDGCEEYFTGAQSSYSDLATALLTERNRGHYLLVAEDPQRVLCFHPKGDLPRQFARLLVAESMSRPELASWRDVPNASLALDNARLLLSILR